MNIGIAIKTIRKERKLSQKKLAEACSLNVNTLYKIESNATFPSTNTIKAICDALNIPASYLVLFSLSEEDIPENKRESWELLSGPIKQFLMKE